MGSAIPTKRIPRHTLYVFIDTMAINPRNRKAERIMADMHCSKCYGRGHRGIITNAKGKKEYRPCKCFRFMSFPINWIYLKKNN